MGTRARESQPRIPVCGIGASAGGVEALQQFFSALAPDLGVAFVVIVHLAPDHKSELPAILGRWTSMPVTQVGDSQTELLLPNHVYVIAPDRKLEITDSSIGAAAFREPRGKRAAIDLFFRSLAEKHGDGFAVVLSGSGSDGALGARAVREQGGLILVQDPTEAAHAGMPQAALAMGVADVVLPVRELALRLGELAGAKRAVALEQGDAPTGATSSADDEKALKQVLDTLRKRTGHDFSKYKRSTVLRRLSRRLQLAHVATLQEYLPVLRESPEEAQALFNDLLISVTTFFRDPDAWAALQAQALAPLVEDAADGRQLRAWVPGCATGEEAYSLAMLLMEECQRCQRPPNFMVFASDVDEGALAVARDGAYPQAISADVSDARLQRFFRIEDDQYRVVPEIRDRVVFAAHSLLRDPPFSRLDLISCRNLLIYLDRDLQEQVMGVFRYAAREDGCLFLGASESASEDLFRPVDKRHRIFAMRPREDGLRPPLPEMLSLPATRGRPARESRVPGRSLAADLHMSALEHSAPPSVLVDERWNVIHMSPSASRYFQQGGGALARRLTDLVRPELRDELHDLLQRATERASAHLSPFVPVRFNGTPRMVAALAQQTAPADGGRRDVLVTFLDAGEAPAQPAAPEPEAGEGAMQDLRERLRQAERRIEGMRDEHHLTTEDLRAANEELQSLNEEYRSTTEELETSKEELQSINEELHAVNQELKTKLEEVSRAHDDVENLMAATNVATLFLTPDLRIKRFTPQLTEIFTAKSRDLDRPIGDLKHLLDYDIEDDARRVLATMSPVEREAKSGAGRSYVVRLGPYRSAGGREVDGVVVTFVDVTALKAAESAARASEEQLSAELDVMRRLHEMTLRVATAPALRDALDEVLGTAIELHAADCGLIQLCERDGRAIQILSQRGFAPALAEAGETSGRPLQWAAERALQTRATVQVEDVTTEGRSGVLRSEAERAGYRAVQALPLTVNGTDLCGVLSVHYRTRHQFSERDAQLADLLGHVAAGLIEGRRQHDQLQTVNASLHDRTRELEASEARLSRHAAELRAADAHREQFVAALGHELRNPLAAIQGSLALMAVDDDRSRRALAVLKRQVQHMTRLVNDLLDLTRVKFGTVRVERGAVDLNQAITTAVDAIRPRAEAKRLRVTCELPSTTVVSHADPERLVQILDNLLRNAVSYTDAGGVTIRLEQIDGVARIRVIDTGRGVAADDVAALFEPYRRIGERHGEDGLGLGLTVVKALVEAHGGTIGVRSDGPGTGAEFIVTLPLGAEPPATPAPESAAMPRRRRVLVVDDERDVADMLGALLEELGQEVFVVYDAQEAVARARERCPEVAFIDVTMPNVSGATLSRQLRQEFPESELTLVAVTGHEARDARVREGSFDSHLLKPMSVKALTDVLNAR